MKNILLILLSIFIAASCTNKNNKKTSMKKKPMAKVKTYKLNNTSPLNLLPKNTEAIVNIKSIKSVFENFLIKSNSILGINTKDAELDDLNKLFGINIFDLKKIESIGINTNKEFGIAFSKIKWGEHDNFSSMNIMAYIPINDSKKILSFIENKFENGVFKNNKFFGSPSIEEKDNKNGYLHLKKENGYLKLFGYSEYEALYVFTKNNYLFIVLNPFSIQSALNLTKNILKNNSSIKNSTVFKNISKLSKTNNGIYFYGNIKSIINSNTERIKKEMSKEGIDTAFSLDMLKSYKSISTLITLDTPELMININAIVNKNSKAISIIKNIKYNNSTILGLNKTALLLMSFGINIKEYINLIKSFIGKQDSSYIDKKINKINKKFKIDIQKDLINNFDGNFAFGTYDGVSISTTNYNSILTIGFKNPKALENLLNTLLTNPEYKSITKYVNKIKEKNKTTYIINAMLSQVYITFKGNELLIASSKNMYDLALSSSQKTGFYQMGKKDDNIKKLANSKMLFYISFLEVIKAINNFKGLLPPQKTNKVIDVLELLNYFSINMNMYNDNIYGNYILKTTSKKPFFILLAETISKYTK